MENRRSNATVPAQSAAKVKGRDYEPPPNSTDIQPNDPAAAAKPPHDFDPNGYPPASGEPKH